MEELLLILFAGGIILGYYLKKKIQHDKNILALNNCVKILTNDEVDTIIMSVTENFVDSQNSYNFVYNYTNMPLGRASAFLNYHNTNIYDEEPYIFLCKRSLKENEFREYGCIVARNGIYISVDNPQNAQLKDKQEALPGKEIDIYYKRENETIYVKCLSDNNVSFIATISMC